MLEGAPIKRRAGWCNKPITRLFRCNRRPGHKGDCEYNTERDLPSTQQ